MRSCAMKSVASVSPIICSTSQPLHTGSSPAFGAGGVASVVGRNESTTNGAGVCASSFCGCGSNGGFSGDDKKAFLHSGAKHRLTLRRRLTVWWGTNVDVLSCFPWGSRKPPISASRCRTFHPHRLFPLVPCARCGRLLRRHRALEDATATPLRRVALL